MLNPEQQNLLSTLSGSVERIVTKNEETGWAVLEVSTDAGLASVIGNLSHIDEGLRIEADGSWSTHAKFGRQFKATAARVFAPVGKDGIERFLRSGAVQGIGPVFAKKIVDKFGDETLKVIEDERWRLKYLKGVGPKRIDAVVKGVKEYRGRMEVLSFLHGKLGPIRAQRVYEKYGDKARETIAKNPYCLVDDFSGLGFATADAVARDVGVGLEHPMRLRAAVLTALKEAAGQGHTCVSVSDCEARAGQLLGSEELAQVAVADDGNETEWGRVEWQGEPHLELRRFTFLDDRVADRLRALCGGSNAIPRFDCGVAISWAEQRVGITLEKGQRAAVEVALKNKVACITGGPGVGKTTILNALLQILNAKKLRVALAAPTGRAARRMAESTGRSAETIHKLLEYSPKAGGFLRKQGNELEADVVIIDESSMVDISLARSLLEAMPSRANLLWVGDKDQLPSVGAGQVLADIIESGVVPAAFLTEPFRQVGDSPIIRNAHLVNTGFVPDLDAACPEFDFVETKTAAETADAVIDTVCRRLPGVGINPTADMLCLIPMNRGTVGVNTLNDALQARLNPTPPDCLERGERRYGVGDRVLQTKNDRDLNIFNGDIGVIRAIDRDNKILKVRFDQGMVDYPFGELWSLKLAFCMTVHKAQGSEARCVVIAVDRSNSVLLNRKLLYTAITRAKERVVLIGQKRAIHMAVSEARAYQRKTRLSQRITDRVDGTASEEMTQSVA